MRLIMLNYRQNAAIVSIINCPSLFSEIHVSPLIASLYSYHDMTINLVNILIRVLKMSIYGSLTENNIIIPIRSY